MADKTTERKWKLETLKLEDICIEPDLQMRATMSQEAIDEYAENSDEINNAAPMKVVIDNTGEYDGKIWLVGGFHRFPGHKKAGKKKAQFLTTPGSFVDAMEIAVSDNRGNGLRFTNADKRHAVRRFLTRPETVGLSDRWIAAKCFVSHNFVSELRKSLVIQAPALSSDDTPNPEEIPDSPLTTAPPPTPAAAQPEPEINPELRCRECRYNKRACNACRTKYGREPVFDASALPAPSANGTHEALAKSAEEFCTGINKLTHTIDGVIRELDAMRQEPAGAGHHWPSIMDTLRSVRSSLHVNRPRHECPGCKGEGGKCKWCRGAGRIGDVQYKTACDACGVKPKKMREAEA